MEVNLFGNRTAFFAFLALTDGLTTADVSTPDIMDLLTPKVKQLMAGGEIEGEYQELKFLLDMIAQRCIMSLESATSPENRTRCTETSLGVVLSRA